MGGLKHTEGRLVVSIDLDKKNWHTFADGTVIRMERKYDNFNMRYVNPANAIVISGDGIPEGSEVLVHHNAIHDTNRIFDYGRLSGKDEASEIKYFSISESEVFAFRDGGEWKPLPGYDFALRVFRPYSGMLEGIEPELYKDHLYLLTGKLKGNVCVTLRACDYEIIFQDINGREGNLIRVRTDGDMYNDKILEEQKREPEIVAIHNHFSELVARGELIVGITKKDAKPLNKLTV